MSEKRVSVRLVAEGGRQVRAELEGVGEEAFVACHDVRKVSHSLWGMPVRSDVNVNSAAPCGIAFRSCVAKLSDEFLQGFNVRVVKDWGYQFAFFAVAACNADILLELPLSAVCIPSGPSAVAVSSGCVLISSCSEVGGCKPCCLIPCDAIHLDLNSDGLLFHFFNLSGNFRIHFMYLHVVYFPFGMYIFALKAHNSKSFQRYILDKYLPL